MIRRPFPASDLIWLALAGAAMSLHLLLPDLRADVATDSFRVGPRGKKALYLLADRLGYAVERDFRPLAGTALRLEGEGYDTVVCLLGPARPPTPAEWESLLDFAASGGAVLIAASADTPDMEVPAANLTIKKWEKPPEKPEISHVFGDLGGTPRWPVTAQVLAPDGEALVTATAGGVQAAVVEYGEGAIVAVAGDAVFDNTTLTRPANALLAVRLLESAGPRGLAVFDESLNVAGTPKVVALLLDRELRPLTVHLFVLLAVFGWWRSRRFGPLRPPAVPPRRDIVAHADAVGTLRLKARDGRGAVRAYWSQLAADLRLGTRAGAPAAAGAASLRALEPIARRLGRPVSQLQSELDWAAAAAERPQVGRAEAAEIIRRLARIRAASRESGPRGTNAAPS